MVHLNPGSRSRSQDPIENYGYGQALAWRTVWRSASKNSQFQSCAIKVVFFWGWGPEPFESDVGTHPQWAQWPAKSVKVPQKKREPLVRFKVNSVTFQLRKWGTNHSPQALVIFSLRCSWAILLHRFNIRLWDFGKIGKSASVSVSWDSSSIVVGPPGLMAIGIIRNMDLLQKLIPSSL